LFGFGGEPNYMEDLTENGKTSHCWNLNGKPFSEIAQAKVNGTKEIL
jgi:hypothetical protein